MTLTLFFFAINIAESHTHATLPILTFLAIFTQFHSLPLTLTHFHSLSHSLSLTPTNFHTFSLSHLLAFFPTLLLSISLTPPPLSLSPSLSLCHPLSDALFDSLFPTLFLTLFPSRSLSFTLSHRTVSHSLYHSVSLIFTLFHYLTYSPTPPFHLSSPLLSSPLSSLLPSPFPKTSF